MLAGCPRLSNVINTKAFRVCTLAPLAPVAGGCSPIILRAARTSYQKRSAPLLDRLAQCRLTWATAGGRIAFTRTSHQGDRSLDRTVPAAHCSTATTALRCRGYPLSRPDVARRMPSGKPRLSGPWHRFRTCVSAAQSPLGRRCWVQPLVVLPTETGLKSTTARFRAAHCAGAKTALHRTATVPLVGTNTASPAGPLQHGSGEPSWAVAGPEKQQ